MGTRAPSVHYHCALYTQNHHLQQHQQQPNRTSTISQSSKWKDYDGRQGEQSLLFRIYLGKWMQAEKSVSPFFSALNIIFIHDIRVRVHMQYIFNCVLVTFLDRIHFISNAISFHFRFSIMYKIVCDGEITKCFFLTASVSLSLFPPYLCYMPSHSPLHLYETLIILYGILIAGKKNQCLLVD